MPDPPDHRPVLLEILKQKQSEAFQVIKYYEAAVTAYLLITGGLLKFALDANATPVLRRALEVLGIAVCLVGFLAAGMAEHHRRILRADLKRLYEHLLLPLPPDNLEAQKYGLLAGLLVFVIGFAGWVFLVAANPK